MLNYWLGVVSADHVARGVQLGIAQVDHGKPGALRRMLPGDGLVYYSPRTSLLDGLMLQAFTAVGRIADGDPWQADEGQFQPWRRRVTYDDGAPVPLQALKPRLQLTQEKNWGYALRRGVIPLAEDDFILIHAAMLNVASGKPQPQSWKHPDQDSEG
ncbi:EVE domain-containing protein [Arthrobacter sp. A5]|uniref:EVE domain-containing protein n=1 Tax=Arthrobacter sp. A5 TaxID=576926 RepID=UPI003DA8DF2F